MLNWALSVVKHMSMGLWIWPPSSNQWVMGLNEKGPPLPFDWAIVLGIGGKISAPTFGGIQYTNYQQGLQTFNFHMK